MSRENFVYIKLLFEHCAKRYTAPGTYALSPGFS